MKYIHFSQDDVNGINSFLAEWGDKIGQGGVIKGTDSVGFLYSNESDEEYRKQFRINRIKNEMLKLECEADAKKIEESFYRARAVNADKGLQDKYQDIIVSASNASADLLKQVKASEELVNEIK